MFNFEIKRLLLSAVVIAVALLSGCSSSYTMVSATPPENYQVLGKTKGSASGSLGLLATAYYVVPMGLNSRIERAYDDAIDQVPGATGLIDVTYTESWTWWLLGTARTVTVEGTAIKEKL